MFMLQKKRNLLLTESVLPFKFIILSTQQCIASPLLLDSDLVMRFNAVDVSTESHLPSLVHIHTHSRIGILKTVGLYTVPRNTTSSSTLIPFINESD